MSLPTAMNASLEGDQAPTTRGQDKRRLLRWLPHRYARALRWVTFLALLIGVVIALRTLPLDRPLLWLRDQVLALDWAGPLVFLMAFIILTALLLPGWPLNVLAGAVFGPLWGGVLTSLGSTLAAGVPFLISRYLARGWVIRVIRRYPKFRAVYDALGTEANWKVVAAIRLSHALPFGLQNYLLGVTAVRLVPFVLTTWVVTLPGIFLIAYLGSLSTDTLESAVPAMGVEWRWAARLLGVAIAAGAIYYISRVVRRALKGLDRLGKATEKDEFALDMTRPDWPLG